MRLEPLITLSPAEPVQGPSPAALAKVLDEPQETAYNTIVPRYTPERAKKAVVLFPCAGAATAFALLDRLNALALFSQYGYGASVRAPFRRTNRKEKMKYASIYHSVRTSNQYV